MCIKCKFNSLSPKYLLVIIGVLFSYVHVTAQNEIRLDIPLRVYKCSLSSPGKSIEKGQTIDVHFIVENYRKQQSPVVDFSIKVPADVSILYGDGTHTINELNYRTTQGILYKVYIKDEYDLDTVPIEIWMSNDNGILSPCYQAVIRIGQTGAFAIVSPILQSILNIPDEADSSQIVNQQSSTKRYRVVNATKLNVRHAPSTRSAVVGSLSIGDYVEVYGIENGWACINYNQQREYISDKYIEYDPMEEEAVEEISEASTPEPIQAVVAQIPAGTPDSISSTSKKNGNLLFVSNLGLGFSNLASPDAYSYGTFGMAVEVGLRCHLDFLPPNVFTDITLGFSLLGNESYSFPYFSINLYPLEITHNIFKKSFFGQVGMSLLLGGYDISIYRGSFHRTYYANPCVALVLKESIELDRHWNVGLQYIRGLNNVCDNLPIGLYHESIQVFATYKFSIK